MTNQQCYEAKLPLFAQMAASEGIAPGTPVDNLLQEAENTLVWCQPDKERLIAGGLDWQLVEDLSIRAGALRHSESVWFATRFTSEDAQRQWKAQAPEGYELQQEILHHGLRAYRHHPDLLSRVREVAEGAGNDDLIQDLSNLAVLLKANPEPLKAINFDMALIERAQECSKSLASLLAYSNCSREEKDEAKIIRDKAYAHLKEALDEIRQAGQYVFWREPERAKGYASEYNRRRNTPKAQKASEN